MFKLPFRLYGILLPIIPAALALAPCRLEAQTYNVRIAYVGCNNFDLDEEFLVRAKNNGYRYVQVEVNMDAWLDAAGASQIWDGSGNVKAGNPLQARMSTWFRQADAKGMRLIPQFQLSSGHSGHWARSNSAIRMNALGNGNMTPLAPDPNGVDKSVVNLLKLIKAAWVGAQPLTAAGFQPYLEYLNLGHDEPISRYAPGSPATDLLVGVNSSSPDRAFINNQVSAGQTFTGAVQRLFADEINRRRIQVGQNIDSRTNILIFADAWDPQAVGKMTVKAYNGTTLQLSVPKTGAPGLAALPGLSSTDAAAVRSRVVLMPWAYDATWAADGVFNYWDYNTKATFDHFLASGFRWIWCDAISSSDEGVVPAVELPVSFGRKMQAQELLNTSKNSAYASGILGYASMHFGSWNYHQDIYDQRKTFFTMEHLSYWTGITGHRFGSWNQSLAGYGDVTAWPVPADYDGDGETDLSVRTNAGTWLVDLAKTGFGSWERTYQGYGDQNATPVPADFDGDGAADLSVKTTAGVWMIDFTNNGLGLWDLKLPGYGDKTAFPLPADYDGDGKADLAIWTTTGRWLIDYQKDGFGSWNVNLSGYGDGTCTPVPADYDGDGRADLSVKTRGGSWLIDRASNGFGSWDISLSGYGDGSAMPVPADYDGDNKADLSVHTNTGYWLIDRASNGFGSWDISLPGYGNNSAKDLVPADYDGDGRADLSLKTDAGAWLIDYGSR